MFDFRAWARTISDWWWKTVWQFPRRETSWLRALFLVFVRAWENALRSYEPDHLAMRAHALTFRTLLGTIPFLAVAFSLFGAFGGLEASQRTLEEKVIENLAPGAAEVVQDYINTFLGRVSTGAIGGIGVVVLFLTVVSLLTYIEKSFNALWNVEKVRPFFQRFVIYWAMVTVGPVVVALSFSMTSPARWQALLQLVTDNVPELSWVVSYVLRHIHWLFTWIGMTLLFLIVPNTRVRWEAALGGGLFAGIFWEVGKAGFAWASIRLFNYSAVYGSLGTLPVFLLWLQIAWLIVLFGCKITYGLQYSRALQEERVALDAGPVVRELLAVHAMVAVVRAYVEGTPPPTAEELAADSPAPFETHQEVLNRLVQARLLLAVPDHGSWTSKSKSHRDKQPVERYLTARDASLITLDEIVDLFRRNGATLAELRSKDPATLFVRELLERADRAAAEVTQEITLAEAVRQVSSRQSQEA